MDLLMKYDFPGNVRELENMIERAVIFCRDDTISKVALPQLVDVTPAGTILNPAHLDEGYEAKIQAFEKEMIQEALTRTGGNQSAAARLLGITERHLRSRLERLNLRRKD